MARKPSLLEHQYAKESFNRSSFSVVANPGGAVLCCRTGKTSCHLRASDARCSGSRETGAKQIDQNALPGLAIAVVFQDKVVYAKGFGVRDVNAKAPVDADTVFQLASVSKPIGSTVVAELVGEGKISWDSKLNALDPTFEMFDPWVTREITVRDMYTHRSGLPDHAGDLLEDIGFTRAEIYIACAINIPIAVSVRITRTRNLA